MKTVHSSGKGFSFFFLPIKLSKKCFNFFKLSLIFFVSKNGHVQAEKKIHFIVNQFSFRKTFQHTISNLVSSHPPCPTVTRVKTLLEIDKSAKK